MYCIVVELWMCCVAVPKVFLIFVWVLVLCRVGVCCVGLCDVLCCVVLSCVGLC